MNKSAGHNPQILWKNLRWVIAIIALGYLTYALLFKNDVREIFAYAKEVFIVNPHPLYLVVLLMPVNWILEALKWKYLLRRIEKISLPQALKGVMMGVTVSLFTPNGIGDFAGRFFVIHSKNRSASASATITGNMAQLAISITVGGICIVYSSIDYLFNFPGYVVNGSALITALTGIIAYFKMPQIVQFLFGRFGWFKRHRAFIDTFHSFSRKDLMISYGWSLLRYAVFCTQVIVLIWSTVNFVEPITLSSIVMLTSVYFYLHTLIPTIALGEIGVRGALLEFLLPLAESSIPILMCTTLIWFVNIVIPALTGLILSLQTEHAAK